jgi:hypothetical protein
MTKKYQLLLHIGLHKTATTSLQHNVLYPLHKQGKINFLGAAWELEAIHNSTFYPFSKHKNKIIRDGGLSHAEVVNLREKVEALLIENKLNVLSDENLSSPIYSNISNILYNLKQIFINCDVKLLISLRSPVDLVFSFYVQSYSVRFYHDKHRDTFEKFAQHLLNNVDSKECWGFLFEDYLALVDNYFSNTSIMLFEDLINDQDYYFTTLSTLLKIDKNDIKSKFLTKKQNTKITTSTGKKSRPVSLATKMKRKLRALRSSPLKRIWLLKYLWRLLFKIFRKFKINVVEHKYPDAKLSAELIQALSIKDIDKFAKQYNLDKDKLIRYHYSINTKKISKK